MSLAIIGGEFKGRSLKSPTGLLTKPTLSLMRKSVFDICQFHVEDSNFLDLFACSGAMGIEAISRGAAHATFIEKDKKTITTLLENIRSFGIEKKTTVIHGDVFTEITKLKSAYTIVYIDPPYPISKEPNSPVIPLLHRLEKGEGLASSGIIFLEEGYPATLPLKEQKFYRLKHKNSRRFGAALLHQFLVSS